MIDHKYGDAGFFCIPDVALSVPLYEYKSGVNGQKVVDNENSALIKRRFKKGHCDYIADHAAQGFNAIKRCTIGMAGVIQTKTNATIYQCIAIMPGTNIKTNLLTCTGQYLTKIKWADLCCYCCNDETGKSITMVFFKKTATMGKPIYKVKDGEETK